ncbi:MAG: hypothetical protein ACRD6X_01235 [Pyrinomonadaceae bacterium]
MRKQKETAGISLDVTILTVLNLVVRHVFISTILITLVTIASGQSSNIECAEVKLVAPDHSLPWNRIRISSQVQNSPINGDWVVVTENFHSKETKIEKFKNTDSVTVKAWDANEPGRIGVIFTAPASSTCERERIEYTDVIVMFNPGSPLIFDEFGVLSAKEVKARLLNVVEEMKRFPESELLIYLRFKTTEPGAKKLGVIRNYLTQLSKTGGMQTDRITFLLSQDDMFSAKFQPMPRNLVDTIGSEYIEIKAEKLGEYERIFKK